MVMGDSIARQFLARRSYLARIVLVTLALVLVAGVILALLGFSPTLLVMAVAALVTLTIGQRLGWASSLVATVVLGLFVHSVLIRLLPFTPFDLGATTVAVLAAIGAASLAALAARRSNLRGPDLGPRSVLWAILPVPVMVASWLAVTLGVGQKMFVGWAMDNDVVWNTVAARFILSDNGVNPSLHPNPSPLVNGLMATWYAPGREAADEVLRHDVTRQTELWLLLLLLASVLCGLVLARAVSRKQPLLRWLAGIAGSVFPLTWYLTGFVVRFGFINVALAIVVLLGVWILWCDFSAHIVASTALLFIATTVLLAAWAPLAAVSLGLAGVGTLLGLKRVLRLRGIRGLIWWSAFLQLPGYLLLVTLPDLRRDGGSLAANGAAPALTAQDLLFVAALAFVVGAVTALVFRERHEMLGISVLLLTTAGAVGYLVMQRVGVDSLWGYYPAKLGWLVSFLLVLVLAASVARWLNGRRSGLAAVAIMAAAASVVGLVLVQVPPSAHTARAIFPVISIGLRAVDSAGSSRTEALFASAGGASSIYSRYSDVENDDRFVNSWLLQLTADTSDDPLRSFAYTLDPGDLEQLCAAATTWGGATVIVTRDGALESELVPMCPEADISVSLRT